MSWEVKRRSSRLIRKVAESWAMFAVRSGSIVNPSPSWA